MSPPSAVGLFLRAELRQRHLVQADLAAILEWRPSAVSAVVTGRRRVTAKIAIDLEEVFSIPAARFLEIQNAERLAQLDADPAFAAKMEGVKARREYLEAHGCAPKWVKCPHCGHRSRAVPSNVQAVA